MRDPIPEVLTRSQLTKVRDLHGVSEVTNSPRTFLKRVNSRRDTPRCCTKCDFFSKRIWTKYGLRQCWVLVFLHLGSRNVFVTNCVRKPTAKWMQEQAQRFVEHVKASGRPVTLLRDRDSLYRKEFDKAIREAGITVKKNSVRAPNLQAHIERFIQSLQQEALDHFIVFGEKHCDYLVSEYVEHYHTERPHQAKRNVPLSGDWPALAEDPPDVEEVDCYERLGGLLKHYERRAA